MQGTSRTSSDKAVSSVIINDANEQRLSARLEECQKLSRVRRLEVEHLHAFATRLERSLDPLPLRLRVGATATVGHSGEVANAYKGIPMHTAAHLERRKTGWALICAERVPFWQPRGDVAIELDPAQADELTARVLYERRITVRESAIEILPTTAQNCGSEQLNGRGWSSP